MKEYLVVLKLKTELTDTIENVLLEAIETDKLFSDVEVVKIEECK